MTVRLALAALAVAAAPRLRADVALAPLFTDHAVLQCDKLAPVWGSATPGEHVTVTFAGHAEAAVAGPGGHWIVYLGPLAATGAGADLTVAGKNTLTLHDVVVGEVWICSGQSNMEFPVEDRTGWVHGRPDHVLNVVAEIAAANFPLIRQFKVDRKESAVPLRTARGSWAPCSPETVGDFTAVGYFFAREIHQRLGEPVGIINSTWGGTPAESWTPPEVLAADPAFGVVKQRWDQTLTDYPALMAAYPAKLAQWQKDDAAARAQGKAATAAFVKFHPKPRKPRGPGDSWTPSGLFNGMIAPLLPYAARGILWYQGESNGIHASEYHRLFSSMITGWRARFGQGNLPFYWVQLANYWPPADKSRVSWAYLREAQAETLSLPDTGMAVTIDIGEPDNIHPPNKQEVGRRLALIAKAEVYGIPEDCSGPVFESAERVGGALRVHFRNADNGLTAVGAPLQSFEVAGADRKFHPASAAIEGATVLVRSPAVPDPAAVRYAWTDAPVANLANGAGLPAAPFRSDDWPRTDP